jgi:putative ABC transport system permease protein
VRPRALTRKLLRDLWHMRGQALAIAMVIAGGVATWIISYSTIDSLEITQAAFYRENRFAEVFATLKRAPESLEDSIAAIPGVAAVETRTVTQATLEVAGFDDPATGLMVSIPDQGEARLNRLYLRDGRLPAPRAESEAVVSEPFAEAHGLHVGDRLAAIINGRRQRLTLVGIGLSPEYIYQIRPGDLFPDYQRYAILWMREEPLSAAQGTKDAFNNVVLALDQGAEEKDAIERLDRLLKPYGGTGAYGRDDQMSHQYLSQEVKQLKSSAGIVPIIFLGVAAFLLNVVIARTVDQQRDQVAVLKAFGYANRAIGLHYAGLILLIVAVGAVPGVLAGAWAGNGLARLYSQFFRYPYLHYVLAPKVVVSGVGIAAAAALLGALRAVRKASRLPPAEAMRPEPPAVYRPTLIERAGLQRWFDQPTRMVLRHIERKPGKSVLSVLGIAMAGAILMVGGFQKDAIDYMIDVQFGLAQREDLTVTFTEPTARKALFELARLPGVFRAEPFRAVPVELRAGHRTYRTAIRGFENRSELHRALSADLRPIELPPEGLLLTDHLGDKLGVKPGDWITVEVQEGAQPVRQVRVAGLVSEFIGIAAYMRLDALNRMMQEGPLVSGAFLAVDRNRQGQIFDALKARPRVAGTAIREVAIRTFYETMGETLLIFALVNTVLAGSIAFGVVYNSARITLSETGRELASLRVLGFTRGEVAYILIGELGVITLTAIPAGFFIGYEFCRLISENLTSDLYRVPLVIEPGTYGFSAAVVLGASVISALLMARNLYHLDLVAVLKTRE